MADFWKSTISRGAEEFELTLSWDSTAFEEGAPAITVQAVRRVEVEKRRSRFPSRYKRMRTAALPWLYARTTKCF
jgi:hypothetical protein